jgi:hypothetical protein
MKLPPSLVLVLALGAATAAACGSSPPPAPVGPAPAAPAPASATAPEAPASSGPPATSATAPTPPPAAASPKDVPVHPSAMLEKLAALGLDPKALPAFEKLTPEQKKKVMPLFKQSLGFDACTGCHVEGDFKKITEEMAIARNMWDRFVVDLRIEGGEPLFCDSCHGGKEHPFDDDADQAAIRKFMATQYVDGLERKDGRPHDCKTCHGDELELEIFEKLWGIHE